MGRRSLARRLRGPRSGAVDMLFGELIDEQRTIRSRARSGTNICTLSAFYYIQTSMYIGLHTSGNSSCTQTHLRRCWRRRNANGLERGARGVRRATGALRIGVWLERVNAQQLESERRHAAQRTRARRRRGAGRSGRLAVGGRRQPAHWRRDRRGRQRARATPARRASTESHLPRRSRTLLYKRSSNVRLFSIT